MAEPNANEAAANLARQQLRRMHAVPGQVDQMLRNVIQMCWMALPPERQTVDEVEAQVRRLMDRAIRDLREDAEAFGFGK
jgi:hypothetical protein